MKNNFFKSKGASDLQNSYSINKLELILKNILYLTYQVDDIKKILDSLRIDSNLDKQSKEFYDVPPPQDEV